MCKVVSQCRSIVELADGTLRACCAAQRRGQLGLPRRLVRQRGRPAGRAAAHVHLALLGATAASHVLVQLSALQPKLEELTAAMPLPPAAELRWADIKAAGQQARSAAALGAVEQIPTVVPCDNDDPLSHAQAPCLSDFQVVREMQRGRTAPSSW